uniref:Protein tweety homolog n=1 Tax=Sus scrofa TaxID=9823 RepID=A0A4X1VLI8_PIG
MRRWDSRREAQGTLTRTVTARKRGLGRRTDSTSHTWISERRRDVWRLSPSSSQSLLFLGLVAAVCLGLNLIFLAAYLVCACCCRQNDAVQTKRRNSCCVTWTAVVAGLICCAAVGVGFYGNSETNDGVYQLIYSLDNANSTFSGIDELVSGTTQRMKVDLEQHLARLSEIFAARGDYLQTLKFIQQMAGSILVQMAGVPAWREVTMQLTELADQTGYVEYYRWLSYLLLFVLDLVICLLTCLGLAKRSRCLLASMLCCGMLALLLSWTSLAADAAAAVVSWGAWGWWVVQPASTLMCPVQHPSLSP